jgi:beta-glucosidase
MAQDMEDRSDDRDNRVEGQVIASRTDLQLREIVTRMTTAEKASLLGGMGLWRTAAIDRLDVPSIVMTDGTHGVRYSTDQIDGIASGVSALQQFLDTVNQRAEGKAGPALLGSTRPATCFPNGSAFACSWDVELVHELGRALAVECQHFGVNLLLGPGINIRRMPLAGRSFEYFSEDPVVAGDVAASLIGGLQENGVGATLKHFACNNSEIERTTMSSDVGERALREIYLAGFERAIAKSRPWAVMSAYNRLNGVQAAENAWLLTTILREHWGYDGLVISDWHGIKDRPQSLRAGNDLDMPESPTRRAALLASIQAGDVSGGLVDEACLRVLKLVREAKRGERRGMTCDFDAHHRLSREIAAGSMVLLKNEHDTLPLAAKRDRQILAIGAGAVQPVIQGSGSASTRPTQVDIPLDELRALAGEGFTIHHCLGTSDMPEEWDSRRAEALARARTADVVIFFASAQPSGEGEGSDRPDLKLAAGQDRLIADLARLPARLVVIVAAPDAVEMPWVEDVDAVLATFFPGQGGGRALAEILLGRINPSGKLTVSFPAKLEDVPGYHAYPGENGHHPYVEGPFVGYRYYDLKRIAPRFPFGHGLSYTRFGYANLAIAQDHVAPGQPVDLSLELTNEGERAGQEVVQLYIRPEGAPVRRPVRELKGFAKVALEAGEMKRIAFRLSPRDFQHYDTAEGRFVLRATSFHIEIAASSRDIRLSGQIGCTAEAQYFRKIGRDTPPRFLAANPAGTRRFLEFLQTELGIGASEAQALFDSCKGSFLGLIETLAWYIGSDALSEAKVLAVLDEINAAAARPEAQPPAG